MWTLEAEEAQEVVGQRPEHDPDDDDEADDDSVARSRVAADTLDRHTSMSTLTLGQCAHRSVGGLLPPTLLGVSHLLGNRIAKLCGRG